MFGLWSRKGDPSCVKHTLRWCNRQRLVKGKLPLRWLPKGGRSDPQSCPCGAATGLYVLNHAAYRNQEDREKERNRLELPDEVIDFICRFDAGGLPQYDERRRVDTGNLG